MKRRKCLSMISTSCRERNGWFWARSPFNRICSQCRELIEYQRVGLLRRCRYVGTPLEEMSSTERQDLMRLFFGDLREFL
jgi:hypothetical protein